GIGLLALLAWRATGTRPQTGELAGVGAALVGLVLLGASLAGQHGGGRQASVGSVVLWLVLSATAAGTLALLGNRTAAALGAGAAGVARAEPAAAPGPRDALGQAA